MSVQSVGFRGAVASSIVDLPDDTNTGTGVLFTIFQQTIPAGRWLINYSGDFSFANDATTTQLEMKIFTGDDVVVSQTKFLNTIDIAYPDTTIIPFSLTLSTASDGEYYVRVQASSLVAAADNFTVDSQVLKFVQV
jgi:hypothetical protein